MKDDAIKQLSENKDQLWVLSQNALRDAELIQSKTIEARASTEEAQTYKWLMEETRDQHNWETEGLKQLVGELRT